MPVHHEALDITTRSRDETIDITRDVGAIVKRSGIREGICTVASAHTTAGVFVNENADPDVQRDLLAALARIVPDDAKYDHAEGNSPAHIKAILVGNAVTVRVHGGEPELGRWQGVFFAELDGPRRRNVGVTVVGD